MKGAVVRAREAVRDYVRGHTRGRIGLVISTDRVERKISPSTNHRALLEAVVGLQPSLLRGRHIEALRSAAAMLTAAGGGRLVVVSDFQETDWDGLNIGRLPGVLRASAVDVARGIRRNVGIAGVRVRRIGDKKLRITVAVRNYGFGRERRRLTVRIGKTVQNQDVEVPAGGMVRVPFVVADIDSSTGRAILSSDDYTPDDTWWFWAGPAPRPRALIVGPFEAEPAKRVAAFFVRKALEAGAGTGGDPGYRVEMVDAGQFFALNLGAADAIFLLGAVSHFTDQDFTVLRRYLEHGGLVLVTPGAAAAIQCRKLTNAGLLSAEFLGITGRDRRRGEPPFALSWIEPESGIGQLFSDPGAADLFLFPVYRYVRLHPRTNARVLLKMEGGDPALIETPAGRGRLCAWAFGFDPEWSDFPLTSSFLPLLRGLLDSDNAADRAVQRLECGENAAPPAGLLGEHAAPPSLNKTARPGAFALGDVPYEVNVSRRESVLRKIDPTIFCRRIAQKNGGNLSASDRGLRTANSATRELRGPLLAAALVFFFFELLLSGRSRGPKATSHASA